MERVFKLDTDHEIEVGRVFPVCGNTLAMLKNTRFAPYFDVIGEGKTHFGKFPDCKAPNIFGTTPDQTIDFAGSSCC